MDSAWAHRRRTRFTFIMVACGVLALLIYVGINTYRPPSCFDDTLNQGELGVDCGGPCDLKCTSQVEPLRLLWTRAFEVDAGVYSILAYANNPNYEAYSDSAPYKFTLYDQDNFVIYEYEGSTFVTSEPVVPIFVGPVHLDDKIPYRVLFEWTAWPEWRNEPRPHRVTIEERVVTSPNFGAEVTAVLKNEEPLPAQGVEVVLIVYDQSDNAIGSSKTVVDYVPPRGTQTITFSWPHVFENKIGRLEFIPRVPDQEQ
jgi:hypothetical protein